MATILLADDHQIVRQGLNALLRTEPDLSVIAETGDGLEAVRLVQSLEPEVLVVDLVLPGLDGLEVTRQVKHQRPDTQIVVLSMHGSEAYIVKAFRNGASAYVLKKSSVEDLVQAVRCVLQGKQFLSPSLPQVPIGDQQVVNTIEDRYETLTTREREIMQLIAEGYTSPQIADRLFISSRTVDTHRANLMAKLGLRNQAELVRYALQRGLISTDIIRYDDEAT